jgi:P63C domain
METKPPKDSGPEDSESEKRGSAGGNARRDKLSKEERSEIAKRAAEARWLTERYEGHVEEANFPGVVTIGDKKIPCAVLSDGRRVLSDNGITNAILGSRSGASKRLRAAAKSEGALLPLFLAPSALKPFITSELMDGPLSPIVYQIGKTVQIGYDAELLPAVCEIWLKARELGALQSQQLEKAKQAEILMRGLAKIGVIALIDEATGYQYVRDRLALQTILDLYLKDEWSKWTKQFPNEFYKELFRLKGIAYPQAGGKKPSYVGHWTNDIVYARLKPGLVKRLKEMNPRQKTGRARKHHQHLTDDLGVPELQQHLSNVTFLMKTCSTDEEFKRKLDLAAPKYGDTMPLNLEF